MRLDHLYKKPAFKPTQKAFILDDPPTAAPVILPPIPVPPPILVPPPYPVPPPIIVEPPVPAPVESPFVICPPVLVGPLTRAPNGLLPPLFSLPPYCTGLSGPGPSLIETVSTTASQATVVASVGKTDGVTTRAKTIHLRGSDFLEKEYTA